MEHYVGALERVVYRRGVPNIRTFPFNAGTDFFQILGAACEQVINHAHFAVLAGKQRPR